MMVLQGYVRITQVIVVVVVVVIRWYTWLDHWSPHRCCLSMCLWSVLIPLSSRRSLLLGAKYINLNCLLRGGEGGECVASSSSFHFEMLLLLLLLLLPVEIERVFSRL